MKALIGRKLGMTQVFDENGAMVPVTLVEAGPCTVTQVRTTEKDGYRAVQLGFGSAKKLSKAQAGHFKASKSSPAHCREVRLSEDEELSVGDSITAAEFAVGDVITASGTSKGKGFAGTIKRHNFHRGPKTHGSRSYRGPGSIGSMYPQNIWKGKKMAGRMGHDTVTTKNLVVQHVDPDKNLIAVKGALPGANKSIVFLKG